MDKPQPPHPQGSQLDRIEGSLKHIDAQLSQILERLARMEERQDSQAAEIASHRTRLQEHSTQIRALEVSQAVIKQMAETATSQADNRWSNIGRVGLVLLGSTATVVGYVIIYLMGG